MKIKDIIGSLGILPHLAVGEYDKQQDKISSLESENADLRSAQNQQGKLVGMKKGGKVSSASKRADGIAKKGKTKGRII